MRNTTYAASALVLMGVLAGCAGQGNAGGSATESPASTATQTTTAPSTHDATTGGPATTQPAASAPSSTASTSASEPGTAFTAYGLTVAWRATVRDGVLKTEGPVVGEHTVKVERSAFAKGVDFTGRDGRTEITLTVKSGTCVDPGGDTGLEAILSVADRQLTGCAVEGAIEHADT